MIKLNDIVQGLEKAKENSFNTDLFVSDKEPIEELTGFDTVYLVSMDNAHDKGEHDKLVETAVGVVDNEFYLLTAVSTSFNGEQQVNYTQQNMTLQGFNYFTKDIEVDEDIYNNYLVSKGYGITMEDIRTLGEFKPDLQGCTILSFEDKNETKHFLTINAKGQLSRITKKPLAKKVNTNKASLFKSAFGSALVQQDKQEG